MATITFDTYGFVERLKAAGMLEKQAVAITEGLKEIELGNLTTKEDLIKLKSELEVKIESIKSDILKWLVPLLIGQAALIATLVQIL